MNILEGKKAVIIGDRDGIPGAGYSGMHTDDRGRNSLCFD